MAKEHDEHQGAQILGTLKSSKVTEDHPGTTTTWTRSDGTVITLVEPPPPWEIGEEGTLASDARRFVECPPNWKLFWMNPRAAEKQGWRGWNPVRASDSQVRVIVPMMVTPEGYIRRDGDILCWMWKSHHDQLVELTRRKTKEATQGVQEEHEALRERVNRGQYPGVRVDNLRSRDERF